MVVVCFWISIKAIERFYGIGGLGADYNKMKLYLFGTPKNFNRKDNSYQCRYFLFNEETGETREYSTNFRWENGYLTVGVDNVKPDDLISIRVSDSQNRVWECDYFHSRAPKTEIKLIN